MKRKSAPGTADTAGARAQLFVAFIGSNSTAADAMTLPVKAALGCVISVKAQRGALSIAVERLVLVIKLRGCAIKRQVGGACIAVKRARGDGVHDDVFDERA